MRTVLSNVIANSSKNDDNFLLLTGDHGYALFDEIRTVSPEKFVNVGIMEQGLISMAAGLAKTGFKPLCYGLSAFVPIRVLEQIKFDVCLPELPVKMIGDGAGLIYTTLGNSHQCGEDISVLRTLPNVEVYSPGDPEEMRIAYAEFYNSDDPAYLRVGKADTNAVNTERLTSTTPYLTYSSDSKVCIVSTGAKLGICYEIAKTNNINHLSVIRLKPLHQEIESLLSKYDKVIFVEEHVRVGGLSSAVTEHFIDKGIQLPRIKSFSLNSSFTSGPGTYQYALSQHNLSDDQLREQIKSFIDE